MTSASVSAQGKTAIPSEVMRALGVQPGDRLQFVQVELGEFLLFPVNRSLVELKGMFAPPAVAVGVEAMNEMIAAAGASAGER